MAKNLSLPGSQDKSVRYSALLPQIHAIISGESDLVANLANICSALKYGMDLFWVGFYFVKGNELVLGPFQGPVACTRIQKGRGVCGAAWEQNKAIVVPDVAAFPDHIACNDASRSEIVLPVFNPEGKIAMLLDADSDRINHFDETDRQHLEILCNWVGAKL